MQNTMEEKRVRTSDGQEVISKQLHQHVHQGPLAEVDVLQVPFTADEVACYNGEHESSIDASIISARF